MMKRALLLLSLLAVPCVLTSYMAEAAPSTDTAAPGTDAATVSPLDKLCKLMKLSGRSEKEIKILHAGYEGDTVTLESLKDKKHIGVYCTGAAAAGNKELVLQCLDKGGPPDWGLYGAAMGGHMDIVQLMLDKGTINYDWGLRGAAMGGHMDIVQLMLSKGAKPNDGLWGAARRGHLEIVWLMLEQGADPNKAYAGLIPVIGGTERFDLALLTFDLMAEDIPTYPSGDDVVFASPTDDLHKEALQYLANNTNATYDQWLDHLVTKFASGGWVDVFTYPARTKKGGKWQNTIFGASLTQKNS